MRLALRGIERFSRAGCCQTHNLASEFALISKSPLKSIVSGSYFRDKVTQPIRRLLLLQCLQPKILNNTFFLLDSNEAETGVWPSHSSQSFHICRRLGLPAGNPDLEKDKTGFKSSSPQSS